MRSHGLQASVSAYLRLIGYNIRSKGDVLGHIETLAFRAGARGLLGFLRLERCVQGQAEAVGMFGILSPHVLCRFAAGGFVSV